MEELKVYSVNINRKDFEALAEKHNVIVKRFLYTFADKNQLKKFEDFCYPGCELIIDSGAYSAWSSGKVIDIQEYITFLKEKIRLFEKKGVSVIFATLDVIPGKKGVKPTSTDIEESAAAGYDNLKIFLEHFPKDYILHAFHEGESLDYLRRFVEEELYIGISPSNDSSLKQKKNWLEQAFDVAGPDFKLSHGFGVTAFSLVRRHPWYSVDSLSWRQSSMNGGVLTPHGTISLSNQTVVEIGEDQFFGGKMLQSKSARLSPEKRKWLLNYIAEHGYTYDELADSWFDRGVLSLLFNVKYFPTLFLEEMHKTVNPIQSTFKLEL